MNTPEWLENKSLLNPNQAARRRSRGKRGIVGVLVLLGLLASAPGYAEPKGQKEIYLQSVITLLRLHANAIRQLATHEFKYSHNLVRHTTALHNTFGLLGPMEWHVAESVTLQKKSGTSPVLQADLFEKMADQCQKSMKELHQTAIQHTEIGGKTEAILKALDEVQGQCNNCHDLLDGAAPDVWGKKEK